jgi:exoribonuclease R
MLLYNSLLAETLYKSNPNTILRTHKLSGYQLDESSRVLDPKLQKYLTVINQNAACYVSNSGIGHQDLNLDYYTHATSPIRRYVDIINQQNMIRYLNNQEFIPSSNYNLEKVNQFQKSLRKFYNYYKKLKLIFTETETYTNTNTNTKTNQSIFESNFDAYIIGISGVKLKVFIPELDIEHGFLVISNKLLDSNRVVQESDSITINNTSFKVYDKIKIKITPLKYEEKFNKKLHIKVLEPSFIIN